MRDLQTSEIGSVAGGSGWLDHRVNDNGRNWETGEQVIGLADPLGNGNTGYLGNNNNGAQIGIAEDAVWLSQQPTEVWSDLSASEMACHLFHTSVAGAEPDTPRLDRVCGTNLTGSNPE